MSSEVEAYPLAWPVGRPRSKSRERAKFGERRKVERTTQTGELVVHRRFHDVSLPTARDRVLRELELLGARRVVISTNLELRLDGLPRGGQREPQDPGVAVYFSLEKDAQHCLSCDRWDRVADNLAAIAAHLEAVRGQLRWGVADVAQAFAGFKALPAKGQQRPWYQTLGVAPDAPAAEIKARFRELAARHHPDRGGNPEQMAEVTAAYHEAERAGLVG